jgi:Protein of unknown function (DUF1501)
LDYRSEESVSRRKSQTSAARFPNSSKTSGSNAANGRDHDHYGFTAWMAGDGVKQGYSYGATDEFGLAAVEKRVHVHDLHATILHHIGRELEKLAFRYSGRDYRITEMHGKVIRDILA